MRTIISSDIGGSCIQMYYDEDKNEWTIVEDQYDEAVGSRFVDLGKYTDRKEAERVYNKRIQDYFDSTY